MDNNGHGSVGTREARFTSILPPDHSGYDVQKLFELSKMMTAPFDTVKDGPDPEENLLVPAGYTYFGQFIDHDLTFDSTSSLNSDDFSGPGAKDRVPTNLRTPRFDLDCVYGDGPDAQPFMYEKDGATLLTGGPGIPAHKDEHGVDVPLSADDELLRAPNGRAIIGDKRNDENSIVNQIQQGFIRYHNAVVEKLKADGPGKWSDKTSLFNSARNEVRWTYQRLVLEDFLPRIIKKEVLAGLAGASKLARQHAYVFYTEDKRSNLPREFVAAAYRFGHSGIRTGYRLNANNNMPSEPGRFLIFPASDGSGDPNAGSLLGFDPLPKHHMIDDWARFFTDREPGFIPPEEGGRSAAADEIARPKVRLQYAYKIDSSLVDPIGVLPPNVAGAGATAEAKAAIAPKALPDAAGRPSLALLNLLRANMYRIHGGQAYAYLLHEKIPAAKALDPKYLVVRVPTKVANEFVFQQIDQAFLHDTPLWFYILAEAQ